VCDAVGVAVGDVVVGVAGGSDLRCVMLLAVGSDVRCVMLLAWPSAMLRSALLLVVMCSDLAVGDVAGGVAVGGV
jgi:hypothetical protein